MIHQVLASGILDLSLRYFISFVYGASSYGCPSASRAELGAATTFPMDGLVVVGATMLSREGMAF